MRPRRTEAALRHAGGNRRPLRELVEYHQRLYCRLWKWQCLSIELTDGAVDFAYPFVDQMVNALAGKVKGVGPCAKTIGRYLEDFLAAGIIAKGVPHDDPDLLARMHGHVKRGEMRFAGGQLPNAIWVLVDPEEVDDYLKRQALSGAQPSPVRPRRTYSRASKRPRPRKPPRADQPTLFDDVAAEQDSHLPVTGPAMPTAHDMGGQVVLPCRHDSNDKLSSHDRTSCPPISGERPYSAKSKQQQTDDAANVVVADRSLAEMGVLQPKRRECVEVARKDPELLSVAIAHWKTLRGVTPALLIAFILDPIGREFTRDAAGRWHPPGWSRAETTADLAVRLDQQLAAQRERLQNL
jgi:hypothetical protein